MLESGPDSVQVVKAKTVENEQLRMESVALKMKLQVRLSCVCV